MRGKLFHLNTAKVLRPKRRVDQTQRPIGKVQKCNFNISTTCRFCRRLKCICEWIFLQAIHFKNAFKTYNPVQQNVTQTVLLMDGLSDKRLRQTN